MGHKTHGSEVAFAAEATRIIRALKGVNVENWKAFYLCGIRTWVTAATAVGFKAQLAIPHSGYLHLAAASSWDLSRRASHALLWVPHIS